MAAKGGAIAFICRATGQLGNKQGTANKHHC